ncbi:MAG: YggN family protein, partial [Rickettsiales bacterium]|nr:YggN family protein [Rickettsiales bacterium]
MLDGLSSAQIIFIVIGFALSAAFFALLVWTARMAKAAGSMERLILEPNRAKVSDAQKLMGEVLSGAVSKMTGDFDSMADVLARHAARAEALEEKLGDKNKTLVQTADASCERIANMTKTLENLIGNLGGIMGGNGWKSMYSAAEKFNGGLAALLKNMEAKSNAVTNLASKLNEQMDAWSESGRKLSDELKQNIADGADRYNMMSVALKGLGAELSDLQKRVASDFDDVRQSSQGVESVLSNDAKLLSNRLEKMEAFTAQSRKLLQAQVNALSDAASKVGTDIRLAESSIETGADNLSATTMKLFDASKTIKETFDAMAGEIISVRANFQTEIGEFAKNVADNLQNAQSAAASTMENAGRIAAEFKGSLVP